MTLRESLTAVNLNVVFALINKRDNDHIITSDNPTMDQTISSYDHVVKELLSKPRVKAYSMPILVETQVDLVDKKPYIDVCLLNTRYVKPPKGAKPWGGSRGKKMPKGKYNCNASKYNRCFSLMGIPWSKLIDTEIRIKAKCTLEEAVSHILWELTFDGWTEEKVKENTAIIMGRIEESMADVKKGNCITLPPKKKGDLTIVIPNSIKKQLEDIISKPKPKSTGKCSICWGNGLWPDGTAPMGPMDAADGMPTQACPECGANRNPSNN